MTAAPKWSMAGPNILAPAQLDRIRRHLEEVGPIAVLHWHYCGARTPTPRVFEDFDLFYEFLKTQTEYGDAVDVWPFPNYEQAPIAEGKVPNENGEVPDGGAY